MKRKIAVLGLDGVPYSLLTTMIGSGIMPQTAEILKTGSLHPMETCLPPISSAAWTSFMTGANPGEHGIFGFTDLKPGRIALHLPSFDDIAVPVIWNQIPEKRVLVVNLPFTYPARPLNGIMICGFVVPNQAKGVYPQNVLSLLKSYNYDFDVDAVKGRSDRMGFVTELFGNLTTLEKVTTRLVQEESWDLIITVVTGTDRLHHFFYGAVENSKDPFYESFYNYYRRLDKFIGMYAHLTGAGSELIMLSDHGFCKLENQFNVNALLKTLGFLKFRNTIPRGLEDVSADSIAFAMDPGRIYINSQDKFENGRVRASAYDETVARVQSALKSLKFQDVGFFNPDLADMPLFESVRMKKDVYWGNRLSNAPDLVIVPHRGYDVKGALRPTVICNPDIFTGMHVHDDAFLFLGDGFKIKLGRTVQISQVKDFILRSFRDFL